MRATIGIILTGALFSALWASAFVAGKVAMNFTDPISLLSARFATAGVLMAIWAFTTRNRDKTNWKEILIHGAVLGLLNNALYLGLSFAGLATVSPEVTVLIVSTAPFLTAGISIALGATRSIAQLVGTGIGFAGVVLILSARIQDSSVDPFGILLIVSGTMSFALGTVFYRMRAAHHNPVVINGVQNIAGALILVPFAKNIIEPFEMFSNINFLLSFSHLIIFVSILDFLIWLHLVRKIGAAHASSFHLLNPIFGVLLSAAIFHTKIVKTDLIGAIVVMIGLIVVAVDTNRHKWLKSEGE